MIKLPVIVGVGGINAAGRSSGFHSYKRILHEVLPAETLASTWKDLACRMGLPGHEKPSAETVQTILDNTLVRKIAHFDPTAVRCNHQATLTSGSLKIKKTKLSAAVARHGHVRDIDSHEAYLDLNQNLDILVPDTMPLLVSSAGGLPTGFDPGQLYNSHHHPRGLQLAIYGASDVLNSLGFEWETVLQHVNPDEISVYAGSALGQVDDHSFGGLVGQVLQGQRINSKMMAMSLAEMPADFINSYVINSVGNTGHNVGACATFLYNLRQGISDIQLGRAKIAIVGDSEAPIEPEIIEGFRVMGALATDEQLCALDQSDVVDNRRACRPFSTNSGFTLAEASQYVVLMSDDLALELGATIYGAVPDVFVNADGNKKSIASPGVGNYITVAKAAALAKAILGQQGLQRTYVQAHGTGTPQNRVTESHLLNEVAKTFDIPKWPVAAIKSYVGHSISVAAGDQLLMSLGVWQHGWIPGIKTIDHIASDVHHSNLNILMDHHFVGPKGCDMDAVIINSKGFGGNNATALVLSPHQTFQLLAQRHSKDVIQQYHQRNQSVQIQQKARDEAACEGKERIIYTFGQHVMDQNDVTLTPSTVQLSTFTRQITLPTVNPYGETQA